MQNRQNQDLLYYKYRTFHTDKFNSYFALKEKKKKKQFLFQTSFINPSNIDFSNRYQNHLFWFC